MIKKQIQETTKLSVLAKTAAIFLFLLVAATQEANADFIVNVQDVALNAGGAGSVNVSIESNANDNLDLFQYKFAITANPGSVAILRFTNPQSSSELTLSNYIHADSDGFISQAQNGPSFDRIIGGDFTLSGNGTDVTSQRILVSLDIEHILPQNTPLSSTFSDSFYISLVQDDDTFFLSSSSSEVDVSSSNPGLISIVAVPEPSSLLLLCLLLPITRFRQKTVPQ